MKTTGGLQALPQGTHIVVSTITFMEYLPDYIAMPHHSNCLPEVSALLFHYSVKATFSIPVANTYKHLLCAKHICKTLRPLELYLAYMSMIER